MRGEKGPLCGAQPTKVDFNNTSVRASLSSPETHISMRRDGTRRDVALHEKGFWQDGGDSVGSRGKRSGRRPVARII